MECSDIIRELITLGALNDVVQHQNCAVVARFEDKNVLVFALLVVEDLINLQGHSLPRPHVGNLAEPAI
jgi:hypothetical protein